ncbi:MAG: hypothetical protein ACJ71K_02585 [Nitrososphaeraceae archaeon]
MTFRHEKLHERQKDLQNKINAKISNDIYNVQQALEDLVRESQSQDIDPIQYNNKGGKLGSINSTFLILVQENGSSMTPSHIINC